MKDSLEYVLKDMVNKNMILLGNGFKTYKKELVNSKWIWRTKVCSTAENAEINLLKGKLFMKNQIDFYEKDSIEILFASSDSFTLWASTM